MAVTKVWKVDRMHVARDIAAADEDGTDTVRSVSHACELEVPERTAERHRAGLMREGWLRVAQRGGRGLTAKTYPLHVPRCRNGLVDEAEAHLERVDLERVVLRACFVHSHMANTARALCIDRPS